MVAKRWTPKQWDNFLSLLMIRKYINKEDYIE